MFNTFSTITTSIFLEGIFFLLIGVVISSLIEEFVSEELIKRLIPKNKFLSLIIASSLGIIFPICECGIVPVVRKLLKKGVPLYLCITLLFSSPIVNIVVTLSTFYAFQNHIYVVLIRLLGCFLIAFITGLIASFTDVNSYIVDDKSVHHSHCSVCSITNKKKGIINRISRIGSHGVKEFFDTGKYFIIGILITGFMQSIIPRSLIGSIGRNFPLSNIFMMIYPYFLSICSNTDAFIARSFLGDFSISALSAFMIFGAMFDLKTTIMLKKVFTTKRIIFLFLIVFISTLIYTWGIYILESRGVLW